MTPLRELGRSVGDRVLQGIGRAASRIQESQPLAVDLLESDDEYVVVFDAPGATASDVQVRYEDGTVLVRIDRFREHHEGFEMRYPGRGLSLDGRVELPGDAVVRADRATATLRENGTLAITLPKRDRTAADVDETIEEASSHLDDVQPAEPGDAESDDSGEPEAESDETVDVEPDEAGDVEPDEPDDEETEE